MNLKYFLTEEDYLNHQLYLASTKESVRKQRRKSLLWICTLFVLLGVLLYDREKYVETYIFIGSAFLSLFFYPIYLRNYYKNYYNKYVVENYKSRFNKETELKFEAEFFISSDGNNETKISLKEIEEIVELKELVLLKIKLGGALIIKKPVVGEFNYLQDYLKKLSKELDVKYVEDLNWKWK